MQPKHREFRASDQPLPLHRYALRSNLAADDVVVCGDATACIVTFQTARIQAGQRLFSNSGSASMGYDLPAAIGAAVARRRQARHLPGRRRQRPDERPGTADRRAPPPADQDVRAEQRRLPVDPHDARTTSSATWSAKAPKAASPSPTWSSSPRAYGIPASASPAPTSPRDSTRSSQSEGPFLCEVVLDQEQTFEPRLSSRRLPDGRIVTAPLEDMFPFLDREELRTQPR